MRHLDEVPVDGEKIWILFFFFLQFLALWYTIFPLYSAESRECAFFAGLLQIVATQGILVIAALFIQKRTEFYDFISLFLLVFQYPSGILIVISGIIVKICSR